MTQARRNISRHRKKSAPRRAALTGAAANKRLSAKTVIQMVGWAHAELEDAFNLVEAVFKRGGDLPQPIISAVFRELIIQLRAPRDQMASILERNGGNQ